MACNLIWHGRRLFYKLWKALPTGVIKASLRGNSKIWIFLKASTQLVKLEQSNSWWLASQTAQLLVRLQVWHLDTESYQTEGQVQPNTSSVELCRDGFTLAPETALGIHQQAPVPPRVCGEGLQISLGRYTPLCPQVSGLLPGCRVLLWELAHG